MDVFPAFRRRNAHGRGRYTRLGNNDSNTASQRSSSSFSSSSSSSKDVSQTSRHSDSNDDIIQCDRCWIKHKRQPAAKRCLECQQNLCIICARCDGVRRTWWLPKVLVQCWRFLFPKTFTSHSFAELYDGNSATKQRHWVHTREASHIQPIPRVSRDSLRSDTSQLSKSRRRKKSALVSVNRSTGLDQDIINRNAILQNRSQSFEGFKTRQRVRHRRSRSVDRFYKMSRAGETRGDWIPYQERAKSYENNWDDESIMTLEDFLRKKVMKGKDIDIELTADDVKVTVNVEEKTEHDRNDKESEHEEKSMVRKTNARKFKRLAPEPYTEKIFTDVPIWFRRTSSQKKNTVCGNENRNRGYNHNRNNRNKQNNRDSSYDYRRCPGNESPPSNSYIKYANTDKEHFLRSDSNVEPTVNKGPRGYTTNQEFKGSNVHQSHDISTSYIVEEPPDPCPICLEDLPKREARILRCGHFIHTNCLRNLLYSTDLDFGIRCPVCSQMSTIENYYAPKELWYRELPISTNV